jgi:branched-chain amino acid transport system substrate-binding protein
MELTEYMTESKSQTVADHHRRRKFLAATGAVGAGTVGGCLGRLSRFGTGPVSVGYALPFEGTYGTLGESIVNGFELRVEQLGGLGGREVEFHRESTGADPEQGVVGTRRLLADADVDFVIGPVSSAVAAEMAPVIDEVGSAIWLNPNATNDRLVKDCMTKYHFRTCGSIWHYSAAMGPWAYQNIGGRAVITYADYAAGQQYVENFVSEYRSVGGTVVDQLPVSLGTDDFSPALSRLAEIDADAIYTFLAGGDAINYIKQLHEAGVTERIRQLGAGFLVSADTLPAQGGAALGTISILNYTPWKQNQRNREFVASYHDRYDTLPNTYACDGYDCATVVDQALDAADMNTDALIGAIEGMRVDSPRGFLELDANTHDAIQNMDIREVVRGPEGNPINEVIDTLERQKVPWECNL